MTIIYCLTIVAHICWISVHLAHLLNYTKNDRNEDDENEDEEDIFFKHICIHTADGLEKITLSTTDLEELMEKESNLK